MEATILPDLGGTIVPQTLVPGLLQMFENSISISAHSFTPLIAASLLTIFVELFRSAQYTSTEGFKFTTKPIPQGD